MNSKLFDNAKDFISLFDLPSTTYNNIIELTDRNIGFSVQRAYPDNISFIPAKTENGNPDTVVIIHVLYSYQKEPQGNIDSNKVPIFIRIGKFSRYRTNHFDYNFKDEDCPTQESLGIMKNSAHPVDLETDEYFYSHGENIFYDKKGTKYSGVQILDKIFKEHCDTVHWFRGLKIRWNLRSNKFAINLTGWIVSIFKFSLYHIFGRTLDTKSDTFSYMTGYKKEDMKKLSTESLDILGYKASKNVIVTFSFIAVVLYIFQYFYGKFFGFFDKLLSINLYSVSFVILILGIMDDIMPRVIFNFMNLIIRIRELAWKNWTVI